MDKQYDESNAKKGERQRRESPAAAVTTTVNDQRRSPVLISLETCLQGVAGEFDPEVRYAELVASLIRHLASDLEVAT